MNENKIKKNIRRSSKLVAVEKVVNGKTVVQYYNPAKHLAKMEKYVDEGGIEALETMSSRYSAFLKSNGIDENTTVIDET